MNRSEFVPLGCSTASRKNNRKNRSFQEEDSLFSSSRGKENMSEVDLLLKEERHLARTSLQKAETAGIPSVYLRPNFSKSEIVINSFNESTVSESDLLQTPRNASTPRSSLQTSCLGDSLAQLSYKATDTSISIDNLFDDFKKVFRNINEPRASSFKSGEEAAGMLLSDEMSWRRKNQIHDQVNQFSEPNSRHQSMGAYFQNKSNTLPDFLDGDSPNVTKDPIPLIEPTLSIVEAEPEKNKKISLSISTIQRFLASEDTPRRTENNLYKMTLPKESLSLDKKHLSSLPVSKNSSYTSEPSENEEIKQICNQENTRSHLATSCSRTSSRASSALTSLDNNKLPIETTKSELIWGCVKVGKSETQEFVIRNRSEKRFAMQLSLFSQEYKIRTDNEALSTYKILLRAHESKVVTISFIPTKIGAAIDELLFTSIDPNLKQNKKQCIKLFGYGGSLKVDFTNLTRDTTGKFWLSLGKLDNRPEVCSQFSVKNNGDVPVFVNISISSLEKSKLSINPDFFVLIPQEKKDILVSYKPTNDDYNFLHKPLHTSSVVVDLGSLHITFGAEIDRGRIKKICEKCVENNFKIDQLAKLLMEKRECMSVDLFKFNESPGQLKEILKLLKHYQIVLTLERDPEQTILQEYPDDSGLYHSLCQETIICNKTDLQRSCYVAPATLAMTLPFKYKDTIFLKSENKHKLHFIVSCEQQELEFKPKEGILDPHGTVTVSIKYISTSTTEKKYFKVLIIIESEIFEIEVTVESLGHSKNKNKSLLNCIT